jgi:hypothetical protein
MIRAPRLSVTLTNVASSSFNLNNFVSKAEVIDVLFAASPPILSSTLEVDRSHLGDRSYPSCGTRLAQWSSVLLDI